MTSNPATLSQNELRAPAQRWASCAAGDPRGYVQVPARKPDLAVTMRITIPPSPIPAPSPVLPQTLIFPNWRRWSKLCGLDHGEAGPRLASERAECGGCYTITK